MTTYLLTYDEREGLKVYETIGQGTPLEPPKGTVSIPELLKGLGGAGYDRVIKTQQQINYLDCIKDGTTVVTLRQLEIFPESGSPENPSSYPSYPNSLHQIEDAIINEHSGQIETAYWHKTKPNDSTSELNEPKTYEEVLWESGLGPKWFVKTGGGGVPTYIKTFGSFIDPLEKNNADITWPPIGNTVKIDEKAMKAMGFPDCELKAKTGRGGENPFEFEMKIGTGKDCNTSKDSCVITQATADYKKYFAGNKKKNAALKGSPPTSEKVKMIMVKEWGDKMQCLIYLLKHRSTLEEDTTVVMTSCDKVVYILCLLLKVPFIYSGKDGSPNAPEYKHYAISHFQPIDDLKQYTKEKCDNAIRAITNNNQGFINFLRLIKGDTKFRLANTYDVQLIEYNHAIPFILGCIADINEYTKDAKDKLDAHLETISTMKSMSPTNEFITYEERTRQKGELEGIERSIATIKEQTTVVPFIKVKKGTDSHLTCITTSTYTLKPNTDVFLKRNLINFFETFYGATGIAGDDNKMKAFARIPFFQLIRGKDKNGGDLTLTTKVSKVPQEGGSKYKQLGGTAGQELENVAQLIGYIPDPFDVRTWDKYIVRGIREADQGASVAADGDVFLNSEELLTNENLEANLITGILDYCARVKNDMNLFDTLYTTSIYKGIIAAGAGNRSNPLFPEYDVGNPTVFDAALNSFFGDDSIIDSQYHDGGTPSVNAVLANLRTQVASAYGPVIAQYQPLLCKPQLIENKIDSAAAAAAAAAADAADARLPEAEEVWWLGVVGAVEATAEAAKTAAETAEKEAVRLLAALRVQEERGAAGAATEKTLPATKKRRLAAANEDTIMHHASPLDAEPTPAPEAEADAMVVEPTSAPHNTPHQSPTPPSSPLIHSALAGNSPPPPPNLQALATLRLPNSKAAQPMEIGGKKTKKNKRRKRKTRYKKNKRNNKKTKRNIKRKKRKTRNKTKLRKKVNNKKTRRQKKRSRKQTRRQHRK